MVLDGRTTLAIDFPTALQHLHETLGSMSPVHSAVELIDRTTLYPLHRPFMSSARNAKLESVMLGAGSASRLRAAMGVPSSRLASGLRLRYCRSCAREHIHKVGESYWRRAFLLPFATHCPIHVESLLIQGDYVPAKRFRLLRLVPADAAPVVHDVGLDSLMRVAQLSSDLLSANLSPTEPSVLRFAYWTRARELGFVSRFGMLKRQEVVDSLRARFHDFHGFPARERILSHRAEPMAWVSTIFGPPKQVVHPAFHVLLIDLLWGSIAAFSDSLSKAALECAASSDHTFSPTSQANAGDDSSYPSRPDQKALLAPVRRVGLKRGHVGPLSPATTSPFAVTRPAMRRMVAGVEVEWTLTSRIESVQSDLLAALAAGRPWKELGLEFNVGTTTICRLLKANPDVWQAREDAIQNHRRISTRTSWLESLAIGGGTTAARHRAPAAYNWLRRHDASWFNENKHPKSIEHLGQG